MYLADQIPQSNWPEDVFDIAVLLDQLLGGHDTNLQRFKPIGPSQLLAEQLNCTAAYCCILLHTAAYCCILLHTAAYCCILLHGFFFFPAPVFWHSEHKPPVASASSFDMKEAFAVDLLVFLPTSLRYSGANEVSTWSACWRLSLSLSLSLGLKVFGS